jgi:hypothetical protein
MQSRPRHLAIGMALSLLLLQAAAAPQIAPTLDTPLDGKNSVVHCPTLLAMWDNVVTIVGGPVRMADQDPVLDALNAERCPSDCLPEGAYVAEAGFADRGIANKIEAELRATFGVTAPPLPTGFRDNPPLLFVGYCHFQRRLAFPLKFTRSQSKPLEFLGRSGMAKVKCFGTSGSTSEKYSSDVHVLQYTEEDGFAVLLNTKVKDEFIVLAAMERPPTLRQGAQTVHDLLQRQRPDRGLERGDLLVVPIIKLRVADPFPGLCNRFLLNPGFEETLFYRVHQDIRFHMDESGAKMKSTAFAEEGYFGGDLPKPTPPRLWRIVFDRPFLLTAWRKDATHPYLAIWVTEDILVPW